jgi:hypothetical protein
MLRSLWVWESTYGPIWVHKTVRVHLYFKTVFDSVVPLSGRSYLNGSKIREEWVASSSFSVNRQPASTQVHSWSSLVKGTVTQDEVCSRERKKIFSEQASDIINRSQKEKNIIYFLIYPKHTVYVRAYVHTWICYVSICVFRQPQEVHLHTFTAAQTGRPTERNDSSYRIFSQ